MLPPQGWRFTTCWPTCSRHPWVGGFGSASSAFYFACHRAARLPPEVWPLTCEAFGCTVGPFIAACRSVDNSLSCRWFAVRHGWRFHWWLATVFAVRVFAGNVFSMRHPHKLSGSRSPVERSVECAIYYVGPSAAQIYVTLHASSMVKIQTKEKPFWRSSMVPLLAYAP